MTNTATKPQIIVTAKQDFAAAAAEKLIQLSHQAISESQNNSATLVFPTGNTANSVKSHIISNKDNHTFKSPKGESMYLWGKIKLMQMDEKLDSSEYAQELNAFANHLGIPPKNRILINGKNKNPNAEIKNLQRNFDENPPRITVLGLGAHDCHIAFNQRGSTLNDQARMIEFTEQTRAQQNNGDKSGPLSHGITVGPKDLLGTDQTQILMLVNGAHKQNALAEILNGPITPNAPGSLCRLKGEKLTVIADENAAAKLEKNHDNYELKEYPSSHDLAY